MASLFITPTIYTIEYYSSKKSKEKNPAICDKMNE